MTPDFGTPTPRPIRVNQDPLGNGKDQFQAQIAVTQSGQLNISYFDRRSDPSNFFIDTYLSRSNNGGATWTDTRVTSQMSDPRINPPIDGAGNFFYGDYQGLAADDTCAIPFWNGTQLANLATKNAGLLGLAGGLLRPGAEQLEGLQLLTDPSIHAALGGESVQGLRGYVVWCSR